MTSTLAGFTPGSNRRVAGVWVVSLLTLAGWGLGGYLGAAIAAVVVAVVFAPWWGQPAWSWALLALRGRRPITLDAPITVANNRSGGGVRVQDGAAVVAVQVLGRAHRATKVTGSVSVETDNVIDIVEIAPMLQHALGLQLDSISVVTLGSRHGIVGDYPRVYDSEIGTPPYAGRRETWLIMRLPVIDNTQALRWRTTVGAAAISIAQRIASLLRCHGLRAKVATATDLVELDRRLGSDAVAGRAQNWKAVRGEAGWMTTYAYPAKGITSRNLAQAWTLRADEIIQNVTVYPGCHLHRDRDRAHSHAGAHGAQCDLAAAQRRTSRRGGGQHVRAASAPAWAAAQPATRGLVIEIGPSGVLVGKLSNGDRLMIPVTDAGELSRVFVAADDPIAKRIVIRVAGAGERVTVHTNDKAHWASVRMPELSIVSTSRPAPRTTVSVVEYVARQKKSRQRTVDGAWIAQTSRSRPRRGQPP